MEKEDSIEVKMIYRLILGIILFILGLLTKLNYMYVISYLILGYDVLFKAVRNIRHVLAEHFLMSIATIGAFILGEYPEAAAVMLLYQVGEFLSDFAVDKSTDSISELMDVRADTALVSRCGKYIKMACEEVALGDTVLVSSGEKIPLDGVVVKGSSKLDTSSLTGESEMQIVNVGDSVLSGCINTGAVIEIEVRKSYSDSTASKIMELINTENKSNSEKFITKFAKIYTPIVVILAVLIALVPSLIYGYKDEWIYTALVFLVVSCPCALVISVPLTFFAGIGCASKKGILLKGSYALERLAKVDTIAFDKTGTLTAGDFEVTSIRTNGIKQEILEYAAYAEYFSSHPIAKAVCASYKKEIDASKISDFKETAGQGVSAIINSHMVCVGKTDLKDNAVCVTIDNDKTGYIFLKDKTKNNVADTIKKLLGYGINSLMLTGDKKSNAEAVAKGWEIPFWADLLPHEKAEKVKQLKENNVVAFVGDGINDAPVLSHADIGISMGGIGSDAAITVSDAVIMNDDIGKIPLSVQIARKTLRIVKENIWLALGIKILILVLGFLGFAKMWLAVFADVGVCMLAVINALRCFKIKD